MDKKNTIDSRSDVYSKILRLYVGKYVRKPSIMQPFVKDGYAAATDAYTLVCFKKDLLKEVDFKSHENAPSAISEIPTKDNTNIEFDTSDMREQISLSREIASNTYMAIEGNCPDCQGTGVVEYEFECYLGYKHQTEGVCPSCDENSDWRVYENRETGEIVEVFREAFRFDDSLFSVNNFDKVVKTAEMLSIPKFNLVYKGRDVEPLKFIVGECTILLMQLTELGKNDLVIDLPIVAEEL